MSEIEIPGYEIMELLGKGGMASVYKARHINLDREVALKIMDKNLNTDESFSERFIREAKISAKLMHPSIIQVYDVGYIDGHNFLSMEYISEGDLSSIIHNEFDLGLVHQCISEMALALDFSHSKGVIHRDIKPSNILIRENGSFALADFGIARKEDSNTNMTITGSVMGTPKYMSPEQSMGFDLDGRSDLYSLVVVFFEMLTKKVPYEANSSVGTAIKHLNDAIPLLPDKFKDYQAFLNKGMAKKPEDRYATGLEMYDALTELAKDNDEHTVIFSRNEFNRALSARQKALTQSNIKGSRFDFFKINVSRFNFTKSPLIRSLFSKVSGVTEGVRSNILKLIEKVNFNWFKPSVLSGGFQFIQSRILTLADVIKAQFLQCKQAPKAYLKAHNRVLIPATLVIVLLLAWPFIGDGDVQQNAKQNKLLALAHSAFSDGAFTQAAEHFSQVLKINNHDEAAQQGLVQAVTAMESKFTHLLAQNKLIKARQLVQVLQRVDSSNKKLNVFEPALARAEEQAKRLEIAQGQAKPLILTINERIQGNNITIEQLTELVTKYQQLAQLMPKSKQTQTIKALIFHKTIEKAKSALSEQKVKNAQVFADIASNLMPEHPSLASITSTLASSNNENLLVQQNRDQDADKLTAYLAQAKIEFANENYYRTAGSSAYLLYFLALDLQPQNAAAKLGLQNIINKLHHQANSDIAGANIIKARESVYKLFRVMPDKKIIVKLSSGINAKIKKQGVKQAIQSQIESFLRTADNYRLKRPVTLKVLTAAQRLYRKVLVLNPFEQRAIAGFVKLSVLFLNQAKELLAVENYQHAMIALEQSILLDLENQQAIALLNETKTRFTTLEKLKASRRLAKEADRAFNSKNWLEATLAYAELKLLSPADSRIAVQFKKSKNEIFALLGKDIKRNRLTLSREKMALLAPYVSQEQVFLTLREQLTLAQQQWDKKQAVLKSSIPVLIEKALVLVKKGNLTLPANNNAHYFYQQVLSIEPKNKQAKNGLNRIYKQLLSIADDYLNKGQLKKAGAVYNRLVKLAPSRPELVILKSKMTLLEKSASKY